MEFSFEVREGKTMPIHEFKCKKCGKNFEYLCMRSDDKNHVICPACGHDKADIKMSAFSSSGKGSATGASSGAPSGGFS